MIREATALVATPTDKKKQPSVIDRFLSRYQGDTLSYYSKIIKDFEAFTKEGKYTSFSSSDAIQDAVSAYFKLKNIQSRGTFNKYLAVIRSFFKWAYSRGLIERPVMLDVKYETNKAQARREDMKFFAYHKRIITESQMRKMLDYCKHSNRPMYAPLLLMWNFGLRVSELRNIKRRDFVKYNNEWYFYRYGKAQKRSGKGVWKKVPREIMSAIAHHFKRNGNINEPDGFFLTKTRLDTQKRVRVFTNKPISSNEALSYSIGNLSKLVIGKRIKPHDIRRSRATQLVTSGVNAYDICKVVDMSMTTLGIYDKSLIDLDQKDLALLQTIPE